MKRNRTMIRNLIRAAFVAAALIAPLPLAQAATIPVTGWIVHNGTSTIGGTAAAPTFTAADNIVAMAPFSNVTLANDGDFVELKTTLTISGRTGGTGTNTRNTQLRAALLDNSTNSAIGASDFPNQGFTIEYSNLAATQQIREQ